MYCSFCSFLLFFALFFSFLLFFSHFCFFLFFLFYFVLFLFFYCFFWLFYYSFGLFLVVLLLLDVHCGLRCLLNHPLWYMSLTHVKNETMFVCSQLFQAHP